MEKLSAIGNSPEFPGGWDMIRLVVRLSVIASLLSVGVAVPAGAEPEIPELPGYTWEEEGVLAPVGVEAPPEEPEEEEDIKPPDWCGVPGSFNPLRSAVAEAHVDLGPTFSSLSPPADPQDELDEELAAIGAEDDGIGDTGYCPPDPTVAAGPDDLMLAVESRIASYSKTPAEQWSTTFSHWLEPLENEVTDGTTGLLYYHPSLLYDDLDDRFVITLAAVDAVPVADLDPARIGATSLLLVGVSPELSTDGTWCFSAIPATGFAHYPQIGFNSDTLFLTNNEFAPSDAAGRLWASMYTIPKEALLSCEPGEPGTFRAFIRLLKPDGRVAFHVYPPATAGPEPYKLISADALELGNNTLTLWTVDLEDLLDPVEPETVTLPSGFSYSPPSDARETCPSGTRYLDVLDSRLHNAVYRDGRLWASQITQGNQIRVYGVANPSDVIVRYINPPPHGRTVFNPAVMVEPDGGMVVTYNSDTTLTQGSETVSTADDVWIRTPSIWTSRRLAGETVWRRPTQRKGSAQCYTHDPQPLPPFGSGQGPGNAFRWGESAGVSPDPDGSGIWVYNVYGAGAKAWGTWLTKVGF